MGALTSNRKRGFFTENQPPLYYNSYSSHQSKKPRLSSALRSPEQPIVSSNKTVSRLSRYPDVITKIRREVHAPCRVLKFGFSKFLSRDSRPETTRNSDFVDSRDAMGGFLSKNYNNAKARAFDVLRYFRKEKEVIDVDNDDPVKELITEDSSVEEVEVIEEDGREWCSVVSGQRTAEVIVGVGGNTKGKIVEEPSVVTDLSNRNARVKNLGNMVDSLLLDREIVDVSSVEVYKKLLESAERRSSKLRALEFEIEYNEKKRSSFQSLRPVKKPEEKPVEEVPLDPFISLTEEEEKQVDLAFLANRRVLVTHEKSGIEITGQVLQCLRPGAWLNDEVINLYLELLKEREMREPEKFLRCHFFSTFFYKKLVSGRSGYEYKAVKRWTTAKKLGYGLIECDKIFVPIHKEIHWCLAIINKKEKKFQYLDSLGGKDRNVLKVLVKYFAEEVKDKSGQVVDVSSWEQEFVEDLPEQENGFDCGMFMIKYADFYSRGLGLCFNQEHMPYFRRRTAKEILNLRAA